MKSAPTGSARPASRRRGSPRPRRARRRRGRLKDRQQYATEPSRQEQNPTYCSATVDVLSGGGPPRDRQRLAAGGVHRVRRIAGRGAGAGRGVRRRAAGAVVGRPGVPRDVQGHPSGPGGRIRRRCSGPGRRSCSAAIRGGDGAGRADRRRRITPSGAESCETLSRPRRGVQNAATAAGRGPGLTVCRGGPAAPADGVEAVTGWAEPPSGSYEQIRQDVGWLVSGGATEVFDHPQPRPAGRRPGRPTRARRCCGRSEILEAPAPDARRPMPGYVRLRCGVRKLRLT